MPTALPPWQVIGGLADSFDDLAPAESGHVREEPCLPTDSHQDGDLMTLNLYFLAELVFLSAHIFTNENKEVVDPMRFLFFLLPAPPFNRHEHLYFLYITNNSDQYS